MLFLIQVKITQFLKLFFFFFIDHSYFKQPLAAVLPHRLATLSHINHICSEWKTSGQHYGGIQKTLIRSLGQEDPLLEKMGSILVWRSPWTEEPGGPQTMGLQRVGHAHHTCGTWDPGV